MPEQPEWLGARPTVAPFKLTPWSRIGLIHGAYAAAYGPGAYHPPYANSWQYRRGFARAFLAARKAARHG